jgi:hypothetical protein
MGNWLTSVRYCYAAQSVHNEAYAKADGNPYAIPARRRYHVCVSSQKLVKELGQASIHQVSLRDALWEVRNYVLVNCGPILTESLEGFPRANDRWSKG